jgi:hypothetical protein
VILSVDNPRHRVGLIGADIGPSHLSLAQIDAEEVGSPSTADVGAGSARRARVAAGSAH